MMMEASFDTEESFDDPSCLAPQPPGLVSPAKRQIKEVKETKITVSTPQLRLLFFIMMFCPPLLSLHLHPHLLFIGTEVPSRSFYLLLTSSSPRTSSRWVLLE